MCRSVRQISIAVIPKGKMTVKRNLFSQVSRDVLINCTGVTLGERDGICAHGQIFLGQSRLTLTKY